MREAALPWAAVHGGSQSRQVRRPAESRPLVISIPSLWHDAGSHGLSPPGAALVPSPTHRQPIVAVFGSSTVREADAGWREAYALGAELGRARTKRGAT